MDHLTLKMRYTIRSACFLVPILICIHCITYKVAFSGYQQQPLLFANVLAAAAFGGFSVLKMTERGALVEVLWSHCQVWFNRANPLCFESTERHLSYLENRSLCFQRLLFEVAFEAEYDELRTTREHKTFW